MILSKKFVSDYIDLKEDINVIAEDMTRVGNEYDYAGKLINATNLVIGEVVECAVIPDTHLNVTKVNIGSEILNIVCGAPNMRKGIKVIVAMDGAVLPGGIIKKSVIRGYESNGMCCSLYELGLDKKFLKSEDIDGIHELPLDAPVGKNALEYLSFDDEIINFELTSNRGDLLSMLGLSYELGAIYGRKVLEPTPQYDTVKDNFKSEVSVSVDTENVSVFLLGRANNVKICESPDFIKTRLIACNIRPINNVVDISNYIMLETGQPLHFYDADKVGEIIGVRMAKDGEELETLDKEVRVLNSKDIVIYNKNEAIGLAGVMGGYDTEVTSETKNILIEAAIFDAASIRKTAKRILRSEASSRFEKGLDVKRTYLAMERSKEFLFKYAGASISEYTHEINELKETKNIINISLDKINSVLGMKLSINEVGEVFNRLGFSFTENNEEFEVEVPSRRLDISIKEDLIEEVGRIHGVDNIEAKLPTTEVKPGKIDRYYRNIKERLSTLGLNECVTYSLVGNKYESKTSIKVLEPMSEDKSILRNSLIPSLTEVYNYNKARGQKNVSIFEIGEGFKYVSDEYIEETKLCILMSGEYISGINTKVNVDFYYIKGIVENILEYLGYARRYDFVIKSETGIFHPYQSADIIVNGKCVGEIGKIHPNFMTDDVYTAEINLTLLRSIPVGKMTFKPISKYPSIKKDVSFIFDKNIVAKDVINSIKKSASKILYQVEVYDEYKMEEEKSLTFTLTFLDDTRTLTEDEVMPIFNKIIDSITNKYSAKLKNM